MQILVCVCVVSLPIGENIQILKQLLIACLLFSDRLLCSYRAQTLMPIESYWHDTSNLTATTTSKEFVRFFDVSKKRPFIRRGTQLLREMVSFNLDRLPSTTTTHKFIVESLITLCKSSQFKQFSVVSNSHYHFPVLVNVAILMSMIRSNSHVNGSLVNVSCFLHFVLLLKPLDFKLDSVLGQRKVKICEPHTTNNYLSQIYCSFNSYFQALLLKRMVKDSSLHAFGT